MPACFSHVYEAKYAGLGRVGFSHKLVNPEYGPRACYVSLFTEAEMEQESAALEADPSDERYRHLTHLRTHGSPGDGRERNQ
jgi:epoxyqueuosine reductase QueG